MSNEPKYCLKDLQKTFDRPVKLRMTQTAIQTQYDLHFKDEDVVAAIQALSEGDFYKSMQPINLEFTAWQDVYKSKFKGVRLYIKFQVDSRGAVIISFKEQ
ncbi:MAG: type II toxin-antitoxin system MqsR family toxin [Proteobacteria bacterium]|nr:type II toxin-antitoxin system MqsR family toxin [Pseudomonadota bacterium]